MKKYFMITLLTAASALSTGEEYRSPIEHIVNRDCIAASDTLTEKQKFYHQMERQGWEFLFNNPRYDEGIINELRKDYEYKIMPRSWTDPDDPNKPGIELPGIDSIWRRRPQPPKPEYKSV